MKTMNRFQKLVIAAVCTAAISSFSLTALGEKGGETLVKLTKASYATAPATVAATSAAHRCPMCTDTLVTVVDKATKGPRHEIKTVARHNCSSCETKIVTKGEGKAKYDIVVHTCGMGSPSLCATR